MIKAVIFDCFGVLVGRGFEATYRSAGGDPAADRDFLNDMLGAANLGRIAPAEFHKQMARKLGVSEAEWQVAMDQAEQPDEELLGYIEQLRGRYKTALLSNANRGAVAQRIGEERLDVCFDAVVVSAEVGMVKPEPRMYEYAARKLGVEPGECVFLDDLEKHVRGAREAGMRTILYRDFPQARAELEALLGRRGGN